MEVGVLKAGFVAESANDSVFTGSRVILCTGEVTGPRALLHHGTFYLWHFSSGVSLFYIFK